MVATQLSVGDGVADGMFQSLSGFLMVATVPLIEAKVDAAGFQSLSGFLMVATNLQQDHRLRRVCLGVSIPIGFSNGCNASFAMFAVFAARVSIPIGFSNGCNYNNL